MNLSTPTSQTKQNEKKKKKKEKRKENKHNKPQGLRWKSEPGSKVIGAEGWGMRGGASASVN